MFNITLVADSCGLDSGRSRRRGAIIGGLKNFQKNSLTALKMGLLILQNL